MSAELSSGLSVKDSLFDIAYEICRQEHTIMQKADGDSRWWRWTSGSHFPVPLFLDKVYLSSSSAPDFKILNATFELPDAEIAITIDDAATETLDDDPFAVDILESFRTYRLHEHELCLKAIEASPPQGTRLPRLRSALNGDILVS